MRRRVLTTTTAAVLTAAAWGPALADCAPDEMASVTVCTGEDTDGFRDNADGAAVIVQPDASVSSDADAIRLDGDSATVENSGSLTGGDDGVQIGSNGLVTNLGSITAEDDGVTGDGDGVIVFNTGTIRAGSGDGNRGVSLGDSDGSTVDNAGLIEAFDEAVEMNNRAIVSNTGTIQSEAEDAVQVQLDGEIINEGTIYGGLTNGDGIDIDSGFILNVEGGLIESRARGLASTEDGAEAGIDIDDGTGSVAIFNDGTIRGEIGILEDGGNTAGHVVSNAGVIDGVAGTAISFDIGDDSVELIEGGDFIGDVLFGAGDDSLLLSGIMDETVGTNTLFDGGLGEDVIEFDVSVALSDIVLIAMSTAIEGASDLAFRNADGSRSVLTFTGFESVFAEGRLVAIDALGTVVPLPGAALLFASALGLGGVLRRKS